MPIHRQQVLKKTTHPSNYLQRQSFDDSNESIYAVPSSNQVVEKGDAANVADLTHGVQSPSSASETPNYESLPGPLLPIFKPGSLNRKPAFKAMHHASYSQLRSSDDPTESIYAVPSSNQVVEEGYAAPPFSPRPYPHIQSTQAASGMNQSFSDSSESAYASIEDESPYASINELGIHPTPPSVPLSPIPIRRPSQSSTS